MAAQSLINKLAGAVGVGVAGAILTFVAFPEGSAPGSVAENVLIGLGFGYALVIGALYAGSIWLISKFKISRTSHIHLVAELEQ